MRGMVKGRLQKKEKMLRREVKRERKERIEEENICHLIA